MKESKPMQHYIDELSKAKSAFCKAWNTTVGDYLDMVMIYSSKEGFVKQVVKTVLRIVAFVGLVSLGFHFGTLWGILAIIVCYAVNRYFDWRMV